MNPPRIIAIGMSLAAILLAGCGSGTTNATTSNNTSKIRFNGHPATISLSSPTVAERTLMPAGYTCDSRDLAPPLSWGAVPANTVELSVFLLQLATSEKGKTTIAWAVTGIDPKLHELAAGKLPTGALVGRNSAGHEKYSVCPPKGQTARYLFVLYALPKHLGVKRGFTGVKLLNSILGGTANAPFGAILTGYTRA
jgi:phosphatidylethanolamine-binding protein (PEBP) family uncharacterized protein